MSSLFLLKIRFNNHYHRLNKTFEFIITYEYRYSIFWCLSSLVVSMVLILGGLIYPCNGGKAFMKLYLNLITSKILAEIFWFFVPSTVEELKNIGMYLRLQKGFSNIPCVNTNLWFLNHKWLYNLHHKFNGSTCKYVPITLVYS